MKYVALLRGINVGGKHAVAMSQLRACFESLGFGDVSTYINSGNVLFETSQQADDELVAKCTIAFEKQFGFTVPMAVISSDEFLKAMSKAPRWWDKNKEDKNNALFVIAPARAVEVMKRAGEAKPEYEKVEAHGPIIFWSAPLKTFSRTRYSKVVGTSAYKDITIRNSNTTRKILKLLEE